MTCSEICVSSCLECSNSVCTKCKGELVLDDNNKCVEESGCSNCQKDSIQVALTLCKSKDPNCLECSKENTILCEICKTGFKLNT